ncbi:MAG: hypothetical protein QM539_03710 [Alphaproteobacteria bacterium]|nr:hypothetical protein [Alphaproteobacteria bacterium]
MKIKIMGFIGCVLACHVVFKLNRPSLIGGKNIQVNNWGATLNNQFQNNISKAIKIIDNNKVNTNIKGTWLGLVVLNLSIGLRF